MAKIDYDNLTKQIVEYVGGVENIKTAVHKYKDSREQFEQRTHKRLIDVIAPTQKTIEALTKMEMPSGVAVVLKMKEK